MSPILLAVPRASGQSSRAGAAKFPAPAQTYFCDFRFPLRSPLRHLPLPLLSILSHMLTTPLPLIQDSTRSAPFSAPILVTSLFEFKIN